jgi:hypothetical protein
MDGLIVVPDGIAVARSTAPDAPRYVDHKCGTNISEQGEREPFQVAHITRYGKLT